MAFDRCQPAVIANDKYLIVAGGTRLPRPNAFLVVQAVDAHVEVNNFDYELVPSVEIFDAQTLVPLIQIDLSY